MVSTGKIPGFIGPPEFRCRTRTVSADGTGTMGNRVQQLKQDLRNGNGGTEETPAPGQGNHGIGRTMTGQIFGKLVSAMAHGDADAEQTGEPATEPLPEVELPEPEEPEAA